MKTFLERNIPILYLLLIIVGVGVIFAVSKSNQSHYERGVMEAEKQMNITNPVHPFFGGDTTNLMRLKR